jgi:hypothetical protein
MPLSLGSITLSGVPFSEMGYSPPDICFLLISLIGQFLYLVGPLQTRKKSTFNIKNKKLRPSQILYNTRVPIFIWPTS